MLRKRHCDSRVLENEQGFAMIWALVVIFVILIGGAVVVKVTFDAHLQRKQKALERRAWWLANSGINRFLAELNDSNIDPETLLETPFADTISDNESIERTLYPWGGTLLAVSTGKVGTVTSVRSQVIGQESDLPDSVLIRTRSQLFPLVLAGATNPAGKVMSLGGKPSAGLYKGRGPTQSVVDKWTVEPSETPRLDSWLMKYELKSLRQRAADIPVSHFGAAQFIGAKLEEISSESIFVIDGDLDLVNCTLETSQIPIEIFVHGRLTLRGNTVAKGRLRFWAAEEILIDDSTVIDGVALVSDSVVNIRGNSICVATVMAGYSISVTENSRFEEGSSIAVYFDENRGRTRPIHSILFSSVDRSHCNLAFLVDDGKSRIDIPRVRISKGTDFVGRIVSNFRVELEANLDAQLDVESFWHRSSTTTYLNWVIDRRIEPPRIRTALPVVSRQLTFVKSY